MGLFDRVRGIFGDDDPEPQPATGHDDAEAAPEPTTDPEGRGRGGVNEAAEGEKSGSHGSHWDTVTTGQMDVITMVRGAVESGMPTEWSADDGERVVGYRAGAGPVSTLVVTSAGGELWTAYPVAEGVTHELTVESVVPWANGAEAQVTGTLGDATVSLFATNYVTIDEAVEGTRQVELAALCYDLNPADDETLTVDDEHEFSTAGMAGFVPFDGGDVDDYVFQTRIESVTESEFGDTTVYRCRVPLFRDAHGEDYEISLYAAEHVCDGYVPEAGDDVEGVFWLQGWLS
ncbi:hypothetical protein [Haloarchaeobius baliensis]|uniref:hypothetical protein n=1 Tax=Haloarchaeobius baliensis TaxID=1670458 RepID=UPI003F88037E